MNEYAQYYPLIAFALNGLVAGWLASRLFGGLGFIRNLIIGCLGSILAGFAIRSGTITVPPLTDVALLDQVLYSAIGAFLIIVFARMVVRR
ncbi:MAG: GlsB/YeaQ/YmgE family stress response membrane protein [Hyphomicrobiaceae bacterium]